MDAPTPTTSPHRWIQAKPGSTDSVLVGAWWAGWWRVGVGRGGFTPGLVCWGVQGRGWGLGWVGGVGVCAGGAGPRGVGV